MAWQTQRRRGGRRGEAGDSDQQRELRDLAQELKKALFHSQRPQVRQGQRPEWICPSCRTTNFMDRGHCRFCKHAAPTPATRPPRQVRPPATPVSPCSTGAAASDAGADALASDQRRAAPEKRAADAEARAAALDEAAARFKEAGIDERAKALSEEAALIRKKEAHAPPPGCRLDMAISYVERAERRAAKADEAVKAAEKVFTESVESRDAAHKAVEEGKTKLAELRASLAGSASDSVMAAETDEVGAADLESVQKQLAELRAQLASVASERDTLRAAALPEKPAADLPPDAPSLEAEVGRLQTALSEALADADVEGYDKIATQHAHAASALARALRQRHRNT